MKTGGNLIFSAKTLVLTIFWLLSGTVYSLQIDSVKTTTSTCHNNGTITVYAKTSNAPLLYSITAGPLLQPLQTSNVFNSLSPGNYVVTVTDGSGSRLTANAVISGNYAALNFNPLTTPVTCQGSTDGKIVGNRTAGTGYGPYTWQLIAPSPRTTAPQSSDVFTGLAPGNYTIRLSDACGNFRTEVASIVTPITDFFLYQPTTIKVGCDSMYVQVQLQFRDAIRLPITLTYTTKNGTVTKTTFSRVDSSSLRTAKYLYLGNVLPNIDYGDYVSVTASNPCGDIKSVARNIYSYYFYPNYVYGNCNEAYIGFQNTNTTYYYDGLKEPLTFSLTDVATNTVVESRTYNFPSSYVGLSGVGFSNSVTIGKTYQFSITDGCGKNFTQNYTIPARGSARIVRRDIIYAPCIDSVLGTYRIETAGFASDAVLTFTSGPTNFGSTKPGFAYQASYTYPITVPISSGGYFFLNNMPAGTYNFTITDGCGNRVTNSIVVKKTDVSSLSKSVSFKKGCLGKNVIYYTQSYGVYSSAHGRVTIRNIATGTVLSTKSVYQSVSDSVLNVPSGQYEIIFEYGNAWSSRLLDNRTTACSVRRDTITIEGYQTPEIFTGNSILCNNNINLQVIPDSSKGVRPYQFEVISGPQSFPVQRSNIFTVNTGGIYTVRIYDVCGNATAKQIDVSAINTTLLPASIVKTCDELRLKYPSSIYYQYKWTRPNGTVFTRDSLILAPITAADTGTYQITQLISINGCRDTMRASYHVTLNGAVYDQQATICAGSSVTVGTHVYKTSGIYRDTLVSRFGCDSIIRLTLQVNDYKRHTISTVICQGQSISIGTHTYTSSGTYHDTLTTSTCDSIVTLQLSVSVPSLDLGGDRTICDGQDLLLHAGPGQIAYYWNNNYSDTLRSSIKVDQAGSYWVQIKNRHGCVASDTMTLSVQAPPVAYAGHDTSICAGDYIELHATGGAFYQWLPGETTQPTLQVGPLTDVTYAVIVSDIVGCSDTAVVKVKVKPAPANPVFESNYMTYCLEEGPVEIGPSWGSSFVWTGSGDTSRRIQITEAGIYEVKVIDNTGCWSKGAITVEEYCAPKLFIPSAFSPNVDGTNDQLEIFGKYFTNFKITIFSRWGEIIFMSTDADQLWDGTYRGEPMEIGTYPWTVSYEGKYGSEKYQLKGSVTLIR